MRWRSNCGSMLGTTEEYNARIERKRLRVIAKEQGLSTNKDPHAAAVQERKPAIWLDEAKVIGLYRERDLLNAQEPNSLDPWTIDHIRPINQGGEHKIENLRLLRLSKNRTEHTRTDAQIDRLLAINKVLLRLP